MGRPPSFHRGEGGGDDDDNEDTSRRRKESRYEHSEHAEHHICRLIHVHRREGTINLAKGGRTTGSRLTTTGMLAVIRPLFDLWDGLTLTSTTAAAAAMLATTTTDAPLRSGVNGKEGGAQ